MRRQHGTLAAPPRGQAGHARVARGHPRSMYKRRRGRRLSRRKAASYQRRALLRPVIQCLLPGAALALDWRPIRWSRCDIDHCWPFQHPRPIFHPPSSSHLRRAGCWSLTAQTCAIGPGGQHAGARAPTHRHRAQAQRLGTAARPVAGARPPHAPLHRRPAAHGANACAVSAPLVPGGPRPLSVAMPVVTQYFFCQLRAGAHAFCNPNPSSNPRTPRRRLSQAVLLPSLSFHTTF